MRSLGPTDGAPVDLRIFFLSLDGSVETVPILEGCGRYPLILSRTATASGPPTTTGANSSSRRSWRAPGGSTPTCSSRHRPPASSGTASARCSVPGSPWGGSGDLFTQLSAAEWEAMSRPRHRMVFEEGEHWDYLGNTPVPCRPAASSCPDIQGATVDLVTMFVASHLPPELATNLAERVPDSLEPPELDLTPEQEFFAGGLLGGRWPVPGGHPAVGSRQVRVDLVPRRGEGDPGVHLEAGRVGLLDQRVEDVEPRLEGGSAVPGRTSESS